MLTKIANGVAHETLPDGGEHTINTKDIPIQKLIAEKSRLQTLLYPPCDTGALSPEETISICDILESINYELSIRENANTV